jgi:hypothetical protein
MNYKVIKNILKLGSFLITLILWDHGTGSTVGCLY